jgi:hypothetical protein
MLIWRPIASVWHNCINLGLAEKLLRQGGCWLGEMV